MPADKLTKHGFCNNKSRAESALKRLGQLHPKFIDLSLDRILKLLARLGEPHKKLPPTIHVAGTNGKGSVIAFLRSISEQVGLNIHAYTSPHLCRFNERIRLNGTLINDHELARLLEEVEKINNGHQITFFEVTTAAAMLAFSRRNADLLLLETGLGGSLDSTNVLSDPVATIITPIALDHEQFLGTEITGIAKQKAGIMRPNIPCFVAEQLEEVLNTLSLYAKKNKTPLFINGSEFTITNQEKGHFSVNLRGNYYRLPNPSLPGYHQNENAALAIATLDHILPKIGHKLDVESIKQGISKAFWPGRVQLLSEGELNKLWPHQAIWLDGAHNAHGARALARTLLSIHNGKWNIICGALNTRDPADFLAPLVKIAGPVQCVEIPNQSASLTTKELTSAAQKLGLLADGSESLEKAFANISKESPVVICGSLYLVGHALEKNKTLPD